MRTEVQVAPQVEVFVKSLSPAPRLTLSRGIKGLARGSGDTKTLEGRLAGYHRLRVAGYRVIFVEAAERGTRVIRCLFAERRAVVYDLFAKMLADELTGE